MRISLYTDLNCPFCYVLHTWLDCWGYLAACCVSWVEHDPQLPIPMAPSPAMDEMLRREVKRVRQITGDVPIMVPTAKPNTGPALRLLAHAKAKEPMQADRLGGILYHALWVEGMDLSDPAVLAHAWTDAGYPRAISGEDVTPVITQWSREWVATGTEVVPLLVREDGRELRGLTECAAIQQFFSMARTSR